MPSPLRNTRTFTFRPRGCSDATDGTNAFPGAMQYLTNLIPDNAQADTWVPRPGAIALTTFATFTAPGFISSLLVIGNTAYGTIASGRNAGNDEPFALNLLSGIFLTVGGITAGNTPVSPPTTGTWTPPIIAQVGSRIVVTHPGFPGGATKFGWFDISGFTESTVGDTNSSTTITGNPSILGVQPGMTITGTGIPANTTVVSTANFVLVTTGNTHSNTTLDTLGSTTGLAVGQTVAGAGIQPGTTIAALPGGSAVTLSLAATATASGVAVTFGGATITLSQAATATANGITLTIAGGTTAAPLWGAGDTDRNNLPSVPVGVAQMNGRAWYVLGTNGIVYSDSGFATRVSNTLAVQALTTNDGLACTAIAPLMLSAPLTGGIVQGLIVFEGASKMQQIVGDQATSNLTMNALPVATGTLAPLTAVPCENGTAFVSPQGLRLITFNGQVTPPIGDSGKGICDPFVFSLVPSRMCLGANADTLRIATQNSKAGPAFQEWWFDQSRQQWGGPHTLISTQIQPWTNTFVVASQPNGNDPPALYQSDAYQGVSSTYVEKGAQLQWLFQPVLLPDNDDVSMYAMVETMFAFAISQGVTITVNAIDDLGNTLDTLVLPSSSSGPLWGAFIWGQAIWGGVASPYGQHPLNWHLPLVFKQITLQATGGSGYPVRLGNYFLRYEHLSYKTQRVA